MKLRYSASIAAASFLFMLAPAFCGTRPHYGGTLRIESRDLLTSLDDVWVSPSTVLRQQLSELLFDRLTSVDDSGRAQPALALYWRADSELNWEIHLRPNARFADDQPLSAQIAGAAICKAAKQWRCTAKDPLTVIIDTDAPTPHLPELLALPEFSITKLDTDQKMMGTGPFRVETFQAARRIVLSANDDYWNGRPYLDKVEIVMGGSVRDQLINRRLDVDDVVELSLD